MVAARKKKNGRPHLSWDALRSGQADHFRLEQRGNVTVIIPARGAESFDWGLCEEVACLVLQPLRNIRVPLLVVELSQVEFFGSVFLSLLLRWWKHVAAKGGTMVLAGASENARELLRITALDTLWALYDHAEEAITALDAE